MKIRFITRPVNIYHKLDGAIYEQKTPFQPVEHDWNNDGDTYTETVSVFVLVDDENKNRDPWNPPPKKLTLTKWEFADMVECEHIEIIQ